MGIVVIGSMNMDMTVRTRRAPEGGETLLGEEFELSPGGKGANQAVACARLGGAVTMIGSAGQDAFGRELLDVMKRDRIDTQYVAVSETLATGVASIVVEESGENRIIVVPGANLALKAEDADKLAEVIAGADMVVMQLETDLTLIERAAEIARAHNVHVILNPAPAQPLPETLLRNVSYLTPNETEAGLLAGITVESAEDAEKAASLLLEQGVGTVIVTLGSKGALIVNADGARRVAGYAVKAVDTVAAGDSFNGALALRLAAGDSLEAAVSYANAVGALAVGKRGAVASLPYKDEVERFLAERVDDGKQPK